MSDVITFNTEELAKPISTKTPDVFELIYGPLNTTPLNDFNFELFGTDANRFASTLTDTCKKHNGLGLSANQCGFSHRVFVMGSGDEYVAFFNPRIVTVSETTIKLAENTLTIPFLELKLKRPISIEVEYQDFKGILHQQFFGGLSARIFQQQLDNLNGVMFINHAKPLSLERAIKKQKKMLKRCGMRAS